MLKSLSWSVGLDQRLLERLQLNLSAGYQKSNYDQAGATDAVARDDNNRWYDARVSTTVFQQGTLAVFYHWTKNSSSQTGYSFSSDQTVSNSATGFEAKRRGAIHRFANQLVTLLACPRQPELGSFHDHDLTC